MAKSGIYAFGVIYKTKVVYVYQDKIGHVEKGKISIWICLSIFWVAVKEDGYYTEEYINQLESKFKLLVDLKDTAGEDLNKLYDMLNEEFRETFRMLSYLKYEAE